MSASKEIKELLHIEELPPLRPGLIGYKIEDYQVPVSGYVYIKSFFRVRKGEFLVYRDLVLQFNDNKNVQESICRREPGYECMELELYVPHRWVYGE